MQADLIGIGVLIDETKGVSVGGGAKDFGKDEQAAEAFDGVGDVVPETGAVDDFGLDFEVVEQAHGLTQAVGKVHGGTKATDVCRDGQLGDEREQARPFTEVVATILILRTTLIEADATRGRQRDRRDDRQRNAVLVFAQQADFRHEANIADTDRREAVLDAERCLQLGRHVATDLRERQRHIDAQREIFKEADRKHRVADQTVRDDRRNDLVVFVAQHQRVERVVEHQPCLKREVAGDGAALGHAETLVVDRGAETVERHSRRRRLGLGQGSLRRAQHDSSEEMVQTAHPCEVPRTRDAPPQRGPLVSQPAILRQSSSPTWPSSYCP